MQFECRAIKIAHKARRAPILETWDCAHNPSETNPPLPVEMLHDHAVTQSGTTVHKHHFLDAVRQQWSRVHAACPCQQQHQPHHYQHGQLLAPAQEQQYPHQHDL